MFEQPPSELKIPSQFLEPWPEALVGKPSAYHYTSADELKSIADEGLVAARAETSISPENEERRVFDALVAKVAEDMGIRFNRSDFVFLALPEELDTANWKRFGDVKLEIKADGSAKVYDRRLHAYGLIAFYGTPEGSSLFDRQHPKGTKERKHAEQLLRDVVKKWETYIREYLNSSIELNDFLHLPKDQQQRISVPEVLVPSPVHPDNIRLATR